MLTSCKGYSKLSILYLDLGLVTGSCCTRDLMAVVMHEREKRQRRGRRVRLRLGGGGGEETEPATSMHP